MLYSIAAAAALVGSVSAHAVISEPAPFAPPGKLVQVNPLNGQDFVFPCQLGPEDVYGSRDGTAVKAGETTTVKFTGSAVHGGGSCQFSVTYDWPPPADPSKWKVLHSIVGGCPTAFNGNIPETGKDPEGRSDGKQCGNDSCMDGVRQFDIPFPSEMKNGKATFAWTWFNKIGNREMYMNCSPLTISGGSDDSSYIDSLPEMFVANIPGYCSNTEGVMGFPNPGESLKVYEEGTAQGDCPAANSGGVQPEQPSPEEPSTPEPYPSAPAEFHPVPEAPQHEADAPIPEPIHEVPQTTFAVVPHPTPIFEAPPVVALPPSTDAVACDPDGAVVCMDHGHFGLCNHGFAVPQMVALGTACMDGAIHKRSDLTHVRRHMLHAAKHA